MLSRRRALDGPVPERVVRKASLPAPAGDPFNDLLSGTGEKVKASTTTAFTRLLRNLLKDRQIGKRIVPIIPDEGAHLRPGRPVPRGRRSTPRSASSTSRSTPTWCCRTGRIAPARSWRRASPRPGRWPSFTAAGTAYATWGEPMIPFFIFYSMFGFQRVGDLIWSFGDARGRGFLLGATAGRTTLQGEGLQHDDGHSPVLASTVPNCQVYDPAFAYELAVIIDDGIRRMYGDKPEDVFYYLTLYNEMISMPAMPDGAKDGIVRGLYRYKPAPGGNLTNRARILASGTAMLAALEAQALLAEHHDVAAEVWSATSYKLLREEALAVERWNRLHPTEVPRVPYVSQSSGPTAAARRWRSPTT